MRGKSLDNLQGGRIEKIGLGGMQVDQACRLPLRKDRDNHGRADAVMYRILLAYVVVIDKHRVARVDGLLIELAQRLRQRTSL